ncbi:MAG: hypothetical protein DWP95_10265 [Proteobacteria bacterium]|nr:MAG: hypothetical protein DWP95_10265 [Pseudomonadota bacterium]
MLKLKPTTYYIPPFQSTIVSLCYDVMMEPENRSVFKIGHMAWVMDNQMIVDQFFAMADDENLKGRKTGQRFICEFLRWKTLKRELNCEFKINNDNVALLAHLYNACPGRADYFRTRDIKNLKVPKGYETIQEII